MFFQFRRASDPRQGSAARAPGFSTNWPVSFDKKTTRLSLAETQQVGRIIFRGMGAVSVFPWFKHSEAVAPTVQCVGGETLPLIWLLGMLVVRIWCDLFRGMLVVRIWWGCAAFDRRLGPDLARVAHLDRIVLCLGKLVDGDGRNVKAWALWEFCS